MPRTWQPEVRNSEKSVPLAPPTTSPVTQVWRGFFMPIHTVKGTSMPENVTATVVIDKVDVALLRKQRDFLLNWYWGEGPADRDQEFEWMPEEIEGIVNLLDAALDNAEGV